MGKIRLCKTRQGSSAVTAPVDVGGDCVLGWVRRRNRSDHQREWSSADLALTARRLLSAGVFAPPFV